MKERLNIIKKAIRLLVLEYQDRLTLDEFDNAIKVLENKFKASAFVSL
jgi:ribosomal protein S17E